MTLSAGRGRVDALLRALRWVLPYPLLVANRHLDLLYIAQLERYKPGRLARWIRGNLPLALDGPELALQAALVGAGLALVRSTASAWAFLLAWTAAGWWLGRRRTSLQVSQRFALTPRAGRLALATFGLAGAVAGAAGWGLARVAAAPPAPAARLAVASAAGLAVASLLAPLSALAGVALLWPAEAAIYRSFRSRAARRMATYPGQVLAITGSYGKTSTKLITAALLEGRNAVLKTPDGVNTTMGISRVVREDLQDRHRFFVVEVAAYAPGEIREVCAFLRPCLGILTAVGPQHLERFGSLERIAETKYELIASLPPEGPAIFNADDPGSARLAERARREGRRVLCYGVGEGTLDVAARDLALTARGSRFRLCTPAGSVAVETPLLGRWNVSNLLAGAAAALHCGVTLEEIGQAAARLRPAPRRLEVRAEGGITKILDIANANPLGARMALEVLGAFPGGAKILVTPGMVELGPREAEENRALGRAAAGVCDAVVLVGAARTRPIQEGLREAGFPPDRILVVRHHDQVPERLAQFVRPGDVLLYENRLPDTYLEAP